MNQTILYIVYSKFRKDWFVDGQGSTPNEKAAERHFQETGQRWFDVPTTAVIVS